MNPPILPGVLFKIVNRSRDRVLADRARAASSVWSRMVGLLGTPHLEAGAGLWLQSCTSVHSFFMRYTIDILFLDAEWIVIHAQTLPPWRLSPWKLRSRGVLELPAGTIAESGTVIGDRLAMENA
jgi:uncharacterized protein